MNKSLRILIAFNEPPISEDVRQRTPLYVSYEEGLQGSLKEMQPSGLAEISVVEEMEAVNNALKQNGYETFVLGIADDAMAFIRSLMDFRPDLIFNLVESFRDEAIHEIHMAGLYELLGFPYTGSPPLALGIALNKWRAKEILSFHHIPTPKFVLVNPHEDTFGLGDHWDLPFPVIVKPASEDASTGIDEHAVVFSMEQLLERVAYVHTKFRQPALVEEYIDGRELNVAIVGNKEPIVLPISEIDFSEMPEHHPRIVTYASKWIAESEAYQKEKPLCPAPLSPEVERRVKSIALKAYRVIGCRDYARVDIRMNSDGDIFVIEVNPNPDISRDAGFMRSARVYGWSFEETVNRIVELAWERSQRK